MRVFGNEGVRLRPEKMIVLAVANIPKLRVTTGSIRNNDWILY
jgi:hypothetical protein